MAKTITSTAERMLEALAEELEVPDSRYEAAERRYKSVGEWLERPESSLVKFSPKIYPQGSFRLGTAVKPADDKEHYDLDIVCELAIAKHSVTQERLRELLGNEIAAYAERYSMAEPGESRRCWTLDYAESAQFHVDILPAIPDGNLQQLLLEQRKLDATWAKTAIAITDKDHPHFGRRSEDWPASNPKGYSKWFVNRMKALFEERRRAVAARLHEAAEKIPEYKVKTPLQQAVQILKRHRDVTFADRLDERPISVILTTLAARSYNGEANISQALLSILQTMDKHIVKRGDVYWIPNPTDPRENFADRWIEFPERRQAFYEWLGQARNDFEAASQATAMQQALEALEPSMGRRLVEAAALRPVTGSTSALPAKISSTALRLMASASQVLEATHRQAPYWPKVETDAVSIRKATWKKQGFRPKQFGSGSKALPPRADLTFEAYTTVRRPFNVFWQITNTGPNATRAQGLRGGFEEGAVQPGKLTKYESTLYAGSHGIECFIVKKGILVAQSGVFVVNIE